MKRSDNGLSLVVSGDMSQMQVEIPMSDVLHLRGPGEDILGMSVIAQAAESIGIALAAQTFAATFFSGGMGSGGLLKHPGQLSDAARSNIRKSWSSLYSGPNKAHKVKILEEGLEYVQTTVPPNEAQFLETRQFQVTEIARWFRIAPHKIGDLSHATFSNIEQQSIDHVTDCLMPWLVRWEQEIQRTLIGVEHKKRFASHNVNGLMRGDSSARANFYRTLSNLGTLSPNDIRDLEDLNPIADPAGDSYFLMTNMATLGSIASAPTRDGSMQQSASAAVESLRMVFHSVASRTLARESLASARVKPGLHAEWSADFYPKAVQYLLEDMQPLVAALSNTCANVVGAPAVDLSQEAEAVARAWGESSGAHMSAHGTVTKSVTAPSLAAEFIQIITTSYGI